MSRQESHNPAPIIQMEARDLECIRRLSFDERGEMLAAVCLDAAAIEASRLQMGLAPSQPVPWPESTWKFLAEAARRVRKE